MSIEFLMIYNVLILDQNDRDEAVEAAGLPKFREGVHRTSAWVDSLGEKPLILTSLEPRLALTAGCSKKLVLLYKLGLFGLISRGPKKRSGRFLFTTRNK